MKFFENDEGDMIYLQAISGTAITDLLIGSWEVEKIMTTSG